MSVVCSLKYRRKAGKGEQERRKKKKKSERWLSCQGSSNFKCAFKVLRKVLFEQGPHFLTMKTAAAAAAQLQEPPQREKSNMTGEGPMLELFPLSVKYIGKFRLGGKKRRGYRCKHADGLPEAWRFHRFSLISNMIRSKWAMMSQDGFK